MMNINKKIIISALFMSGCLSGCGSDGDDGKDGNDGENGNNGNDGLVTVRTANALNLTVDDVSINSEQVTSVLLTALNENEIPVIGLTDANIGFYMHQLMPADEVTGEAPQWLAYGADCSGAPGATPSCKGELVDNNDGSYQYTFSVPLDSSFGDSPPVKAISYDELATQRLLLSTKWTFPNGDKVPNVNLVYDFSQNGDITIEDGLVSREMVDGQTCISCHADFGNIYHGGTYNTLESCNTCHNDNKGHMGAENVFTRLVHSAHIELKTDGGANNYPQSAINCDTCHQESESLPQWNDFARYPSEETCRSCHDSVTTIARPMHEAGYPTGPCAQCHTSTSVDIAHAHLNVKTLAANAKERFNVELLDMQVSGYTYGQNAGQASIELKVMVDGTAVDPTKLDYLSYNHISVIYPEFFVKAIFGNQDDSFSRMPQTGETDFGAIYFDIVSDNAEKGSMVSYDAATGITTVTVTDKLPSTIVENYSGTLVLDGELCFNKDSGEFTSCTESAANGGQENIYTVTPNAVSAAFNSDGVVTESADNYTAVARRQIIADNKCTACHNTLNDAATTLIMGDDSWHHDGDWKGETIETKGFGALKHHGVTYQEGGCLTCHNPNSPRKVGMIRVDAALPEAIAYAFDYKVMVHGIHSGTRGAKGINNYSGRPSMDFSEINYPAGKSNCLSCHVEDSFNLDKVEQTTPVLVRHNNVVDTFISPAAATCLSCHTSESAKQHTISSGNASFDGTPTVEACSVCHSQEKIAAYHIK
ncbi:OmcA/MtrC family decaheme c-type cytochrome [Shewanella sp. KX20019]|uniref:OmcA/MtrC family decaheme c-type cytochrome n=1 Tax=Shewanella sp. KX20019 TaxID=2803864 RepID=UPI0019265CEB|nr:OmcA/MtrC family decaheme c-type cytochrome [Shewanella sp. KX20019]QQX80782.1 OmcA/MtrC family decaheme c-type cytochrome [Shewanella sp. KX20019]